jgi:hypothetical protein
MDYKAIGSVAVVSQKNAASVDERDLEKFVSKVQGQFSEEKIGGDNQDGGKNYGLSGGATNTLGATADVESFVAANGREDETVNHGLGETLHQVGEVEGLDGASPKFNGA